MNTEINFLEKQPGKYTDFLVFLLIFFVLLVSVIIVLLGQKNSYESDLVAVKENISQLEVKLKEKNQDNKYHMQLNKIKEKVALIREAEKPVVASYYSVLQELENQDQLLQFEYTKENKLLIDAEFAEIEDAAAYIETLVNKQFIIDIDLTSMIKLDNAYQATLTIILDKDNVIKEFGGDD